MDVFELYAKIGADLSGFESGISKAKDMGKSVFSGIGNIAKVGFGVATAAVAAGTAAVGAFGKEAVASYANYEQLEGGVKKLYGESDKAYQTMMKNAQQAYMTAGMSANQYMETATSFSASLISSLGNDLDKASEMTDVAMRLISDNANTFGSDAQSISQSIMALSRNNFTMLDNLKLGFSGSKEGMQQLIDKANELREANGEMGNLSIESFADMITAIQTVQEDFGVAGTTAKEAMTTIEGSANATKAAWENVITAIGRGEGLGDAFGQLKTAIFGTDEEGTGLLAQIIPRVQTTMEGIGEFIGQSAPIFSEKLPELIGAVLPSMIEGGISLAGALGEGLISALPSIWKGVESAASTIGDYLYKGVEIGAKATENIDFATPIGSALDKVDELLNGEKTQTFIQNGVTMVANLAKGIGDGAPEIIPKAVEIVTTFADNITDNIPVLLDAGGKMAIGLAEGILKSAPKVWLTFYTIKFKVIGYITEMALGIVNKGKEGITNLINTVSALLPQLPSKIAYFAGYAVTKFVIAWVTFPQKATEILNKIIDKVKEWGTSMKEKASTTAKEFVDDMVNGFADLPSKMWNIGVEAINNLINGFKSLWGSFKSMVRDAGNGSQQAIDEYNEKVAVQGAYNPQRVIDNNMSLNGMSAGIDYDLLATAIVKAFVASEITVECDDREFGRLVRKVVTT